MIKSKKGNKSLKSTGKYDGEADLQTVKKIPIKTSFFLITVIGIIVIVAVVIVAKTYLDEKPTEQANEKPIIEQQINEEATDLEKLVNRVAQMIEVNSEEEPTIATVEDPDLLMIEQSEFYKDAEIGDRLLIWSDKAVLYSTKKDKLLSVMLSATQESATSTETDFLDISSTIAEEKPTINVKNGTFTAGVAGKMRLLLTSANIPVAGIGDAKFKNYEQTVIIQITDKEMPATLKALREATGAEVGSLRDGETGLTGDFVVIVGSDFIQ